MLRTVSKFLLIRAVSSCFGSGRADIRLSVCFRQVLPQGFCDERRLGKTEPPNHRPLGGHEFRDTFEHVVASESLREFSIRGAELGTENPP